MKILHLTDFHYSKESSIQLKVVDSIISSILNEGCKIDLVFFTGDLVQNGNKIENFKNASNLLFENLSIKLGIKKENFIFCPGNHDIDRNAVHGALKAYVDTNINTNISLNEFYKKKTDSVFLDSIKPSINFYNFLNEYHPANKENIIKDLYSIHYRNINGKRNGIVCLNSAWISAIDKDKTSKEDKGNLLIPLDLLDDIKKDIGTVDRKIILLHHPLYFLKEFNFYGVESFIHNEFELKFSGHVHKISSIAIHSGSNGIFEHVAKASLSAKENLGCSLVEIDEIQENIIRIKELTYITDNDSCHIGNEIVHTIPCGNDKLEIIAFRKKLFDKILYEKENANNLLLLKENEENEDFLTLYNHPVLKRESESGLETKKTEIVGLEEIIKCQDNFLILGKDKCGKTTLLKRIQIECLINYSKNGKIPFFFDAKEYESKLDRTFNIESLIRSYFEVNRAKVQEILSSNDFLLLVDNYTTNSSMAEYLNNFLKEHPNIKFIICSEYNLSRTVDSFQFGSSIYDKLFFHDLRRKEIIAYTDKRLASNQNKQDVQEKIIQFCKQLELPLNYWTVSLLLLIHSKSSESYSKNLFSLLDVCVDEIFGKKQLLLTNSRISFDQLKKICAELAKELFINHKKTIYSALYEDILNQISKTISENNRISANSRDVFDYLVYCGILKRKNGDDYYVFRLNGFFEYFLALQMTKDNKFKNDILDDDVKYLAFKNQLEIYSGFKRDDLEFLQKIFVKSNNKLSLIFKKYNIDKDQELLEKVNEPTLIEDFCRDLSIKKALSSNEKAELEDLTDELFINADVHEIKEMNPDDINSELVERYLSILARIFRNSDEISGNKDEISKIFNFLINSYCDLGFFIIDEFSLITKQEATKDDCIDFTNFPELELLRFISNFTTLISQSCLFDGLGHFNLERMIKDEIEKLETTSNENQYKLFMLYFLLLDIDLNSNKEYIQIAMDKLKIPVIKYAIFLKLNYYLAFKGENNKALKHDLTLKIQKAKLNIDNSSSISEIQRQIQVKKKISYGNKDML